MQLDFNDLLNSPPPPRVTPESPPPSFFSRDLRIPFTAGTWSKPGVSRYVIVDMGSATTRVGLDGEQTPKNIFPTLVGRPKICGYDTVDCYVGSDALANCDTVAMRLKDDVINAGQVRYWHDFEKILWYCMYRSDLNIEFDGESNENALVLCIPTTLLKKQKEKMMGIAFDTFGFQALSLLDESVLSVFALGQESGLSLQVGHGLTCAVPVVNGHALRWDAQKTALSGVELETLLDSSLRKRRDLSWTRATRISIREIKESLLFVCPSSDAFVDAVVQSDAVAHADAEYELPDGSHVTVGEERFRVPEILFEPSSPSEIQPSANSLPSVVEQALNSLDQDTLEMLGRKLCVTGGTTHLHGFDTRLKHELRRMGMSDLDLIQSDPETSPGIEVYRGAVLSTSLSSFASRCIPKSEYETVGAGVVHRGCF